MTGRVICQKVSEAKKKMVEYKYTARDQQGAQVQGTLRATDSYEVREQLRRKNLFVTVVEEQFVTTARMSRPRFFASHRIKLNDMVVMSRQFATLIGSGMPLVECLQSLIAQTDAPPLAKIIREVRNDVLGGSTLTEAMSRHPKAFNELYISLVGAGEAAGKLEEMLEIAAIQFEREADLKAKVASALLYPMLVIGAAAGVVVFLLAFVVPVFQNIYNQFKVELPAVTRLMVTMSHVILYYGWVVVLGLAGAVFLLKRYAKTPAGRTRLDKFKLGLPILGRLLRKVAIARFIRTLSAMVKAGVPILKGLTVAASTSGNSIIAAAVIHVAGQVRDGSTLWIPLEQTGQFPSMVGRMVAAGEQSGNLDAMLARLAGFYERDIEHSINNMTRVLEPMLTILVGVIVLFILVALYMPIFSLSKVISH